MGLRAAGWSPARITGLWLLVTAVAGSHPCSASRFSTVRPADHEFVLAFAGGAILTMLADTMMPEAFDHGGRYVGLAATAGFGLAFAITGCGRPGCQHARHGTSDVPAVRTLWDEAFNGRDLDALDAITAPEFLNHNALPGTPRGPEGHRQVFERLWTAFPDARFEIEHLAGDGDTVICVGRMSGTHEGSVGRQGQEGRGVHLR